MKKYNPDHLRLALCMVSFFLMLYIPLSAYKKSMDDLPALPAPTIWHEVKIEVTFHKENKDTFDLEVYGDERNIWIKNGDIGYMKTTKQASGKMCYPVIVCSFARTYRILSSVKHIVNEQS